MNETTGALGMVTDRDVMVPMRDGVCLSSNVFRPDAGGPFPVLVHRTPYGKRAAGFEAFVRAGYAVVSQDTRGRYGSEGEFRVFSEEDTRDGEDGFDSVEWAAARPWSTGCVGTFGVSYDAWMQYRCARERPPHLKAMSAVSIPTELTGVDWPGAFKPARRIRWWLTTIAPDLRRRAGWPPPHTPAEAARIWDTIEKGMKLGTLPWGAVTRWLPPPLSEQVAHWLRDPARPVWNFEEAHRDIAVPNLDFTGWFDHCCSLDHFGGMRDNARSATARQHTKVVLGPWNHCNLGRRKQADFDFGPQAEIPLQQMQIEWFDHWLKGIDNGVCSHPPVRYFVMGSKTWKTADTWPPPGGEPVRLWLDSGGDADDPDGTGRLMEKPPAEEQPDRYTFDPLDPVPTLWSPACFYNVSDRRLLDHRRDILRYRSEPLEQDLEIAGTPEVILYASSSARDTDFFVRLCDDDPDGPAMEVTYGMLRARRRNGFQRSDLLSPGQVTEFRIRMGPTACRFRKSHRIRLEITSSDFPNHDRNHNLGRDDLFDPKLAVAEQCVHHSETHPSALVLPAHP